MSYLITTNTNTPFITDWFDSENHYIDEIDMVVYDLINQKYTTDGVNWNDIIYDEL